MGGAAPAADRVGDDLRLEAPDLEHLAASVLWFKDPVFRALIESPEVSDDDQRRWLEGLPGRSDYLAFAIKQGPVSIGTVGIRCLTPRGGESFIHIGQSVRRGSGAGLRALQLLIAEAQARGIPQLWARIRADNVPSIICHQRAGYRPDPALESRTHVTMSCDVAVAAGS